MNRPAVIISADVLSWFKFSVVKKENWQMQISKQQRDALLRESNTLLREIHALYSGFDRRFHLRGAEVPVTFGFDTDQLGSYTQGKDYSEEEFHFSLLFIGRSLPHPLSKEDRIDLYKHEYAHYMQYNMPIEQKYQWQYGTHGSAWKYCCSLIGAAPTPLYRAGEGSMEHDYEKALKKPVSDRTIPVRDVYHREMDYRNSRARIVRYKVGEQINHPRYGIGEIVDITCLTDSVRISIQFADHIRVIDQMWLVKHTQKVTGS